MSTPAHDQKITLHILEHYPSREPRAHDPHYRFFNAARDRLKKLGKLVCWIGNEDCAGQIELHHDKVEFALANSVDVARFAKLYPEFGIMGDDDFLRVIESEGNLTPLCKIHHTGIFGVHVLPMPIWGVQRFCKKGMRPAEVVKA